MLPSNETAEKAILSICSQHPHRTTDLKADRFFNPIHAEIFQILAKLFEESNPTDLLAFTAHVEGLGRLASLGGASYLTEVIGTVTGGDLDFEYYFEQLEKAYAYRQFILACKKSVVDAKHMEIPLEELVSNISRAGNIEVLDQEPKIKEQLNDLLNDLEATQVKERFSTGVRGLDSLIGGGIERQEFLVVAGDTGKGKSILLGQIAVMAVQSHKKVAFFSLEMSDTSVLQRFVSNIAGFNVRPISEGSLNIQQHKKLLSSISDLSKSSLYLFDRETNLDRILGIASKLLQKQGLDIMIIDYLQRIDEEGDNRESSIASSCRRIKSFAKNNNIVSVSASQINDNGLLFASRTIGHEADILVKIADDKLLVNKNRRGPQNVFCSVRRIGELARFEDLI